VTSVRAPAPSPGRRASPWGRAWIEVSVVTSPGAAEAVGAILADLRSGGLVEDRLSPSRVRLRCYLPPSRSLSVTLAALRARVRSLARFGVDPRPGRVTHRRLAARRWATAWRTWAHPVRVGRLLVTPSWIRRPAEAGRTVITVDPGMAFGTGLHASTRLCLRALLRRLRPRQGRAPSRVIDVGTGSGILAIAACRLGAARVWAVDNDPVAVAVARANVRQNGVAGRVRVRQGTGLTRVPGRADLIVANLIAEAVIGLLPRVRRHLTPGGVFIGSGIVAPRLPGVLRAARAAGLTRIAVLTEGEWRAVVLTPAAPASRDAGARGGPVISARRLRRWRSRGKTRRRRGRR
jgi:ribosomal protein L11 methyltransferase